MNKKGNLIALMGLGIVVLVVIMGAFFITLGSGIITFSADTINDITTGLGTAGDSNLSYYSEVSIGTLNSSLQMMKWGTGVLLLFSLLGIIIFATSIRLNPSGYLIGFYLLLVIVLVFTAVLMSNAYEDITSGTDELAVELSQMPVSSFLIVHMPLIITIMAFIGGIIIFSGLGEEFV